MKKKNDKILTKFTTVENNTKCKCFVFIACVSLTEQIACVHE